MVDDEEDEHGFITRCPACPKQLLVGFLTYSRLTSVVPRAKLFAFFFFLKTFPL